ncbi:MAG: hypothetical protein ROZ36_17145 [Thermincola sp.]|nr:hypothetical protein [Thermincola sp.]
MSEAKGMTIIMKLMLQYALTIFKTNTEVPMQTYEVAAEQFIGIYEFLGVNGYHRNFLRLKSQYSMVILV